MAAKRKGENEDIRREIQDAMLHEKLQVAIRLPMLGCVVHCN